MTYEIIRVYDIIYSDSDHETWYIPILIENSKRLLNLCKKHRKEAWLIELESTGFEGYIALCIKNV